MVLSTLDFLRRDESSNYMRSHLFYGCSFFILERVFVADSNRRGVLTGSDAGLAACIVTEINYSLVGTKIHPFRVAFGILNLAHRSL